MSQEVAYEFGSYRLEPGEARLLRAGERVQLPPKALELLGALVKRAGHVVTKEQLLAEVWPDVVVEEGNLSVTMSTLRKALADDAGHACIETVAKHGYRFSGVVHEVAARPLPAAAPIATQEAGPPAGQAPPAPGRRWGLGAAMLVALGAVLSIPRLRPATQDQPVRSIAVLPFRTIPASADQRHLELGMADAVIMRLGAVPQLSVPPTAALRAIEDPFDAGRRLKVDAVLTSTIQRAGDRLRVTSQLSRVSDRSQIWAGRFDEPFTDIFSVQDAIAERIAGSLQRDDGALEPAALRRRETENVAAYELYLRGRERWSRRTMDTIRSAIQLYQDAIRLDPGFALAYAGLADAYATTASGLAPKERFPLAKRAAERALQLDRSLAEAHVALAFVSYKAEWNWPLAQAELTEAIRLNRNYSFAHHQFGELHMALGQWNRAIDDFRRARALDPYLLHTRMDLGAALVLAGRVPEARAMIQEGLQQDPNSWEMRQGLGEVLVAENRLDEGIAEDLKARALRGESTDTATLLEAYQRGGRPAFFRAENELLRARLERGVIRTKGAASELACNHARLRDGEQALHWLQVAIDRGEEAPMYLNRPFFDFLRGDSRFNAIYRRVFGSDDTRGAGAVPIPSPVK